MTNGPTAPAEQFPENDFAAVIQFCDGLLSSDYEAPDADHLVAESTYRRSLGFSDTTDVSLSIFQYRDPESGHDMYYLCEAFTPSDERDGSSGRKTSEETHENYYFYTLDATSQTVTCDYVGVFVSGKGHKRKREVAVRDDGLSVTSDQTLAGDWKKWVSFVQIKEGEESTRARRQVRTEESMLRDLRLTLQNDSETGTTKLTNAESATSRSRRIGFLALQRMWNFGN